MATDINNNNNHNSNNNNDNNNSTILNPLTALIINNKQNVLVLDGGMATLLEQQFSCIFNTKLWSAVYNTNDKLYNIVNAHNVWLHNGANIIISNTYQAPISNSTDYNNENLFINGINAVVQAKLQYRIQYNKQCIACISCGPYAAYLADGSEYNGDYKQHSIDDIKSYHHNKLELIKQYKYNIDNNITIQGYDIIIFETIPNYDEIKIILELIKEYNTIPFLLSLSCNTSSTLNDNTDIDIVLDYIIQHYSNTLIGFGFNCTPPYYIARLLENTKKIFQQHEHMSSIHLLCYGNSGEIYDGNSKTWQKTNDSSIEQWNEYTLQWINAGATIIGGCCRTTPQHINTISNTIIKHASHHQQSYNMLLNRNNIRLHISEPYYSYIRQHKKLIESRLDKSPISYIHKDSILVLYTSNNNDSITVRVNNVIRYRTFTDLLNNEGLHNVLHDIDSIDTALTIYRQWYSKQAEQQLGVIVIHFDIIS